MSRSRAFALIAGGGTAGHVNPALAIADALVELGHPKNTIRLIGSAKGLEATLVPPTGYDITLLPGRGIVRRVGKDSAIAVWGLLVALVKAIFVVARSRPRVVVSVGGYAAAPCSFAAVFLGIPVVLAESNAVPGAVNRILGRFAKASAVGLPGTKLPRAIITGNPVRPEITELDRSTEQRNRAKGLMGLPVDRLVVVAFGGSLGSLTINKAMIDLAGRWHDRGDVAMHHVIGRRDWNDDTFKRSTSGDETSSGEKLVYQAVEYENRMSLMYQCADIVVCRAGSTTIAEVTAAGLPTVLVPLPNAPADHQTANARSLEAAGAAIVVTDSQCNGEMLASILGPLLDDEAHRELMSKAARGLAIPDAAQRVARLVEQHARVPRHRRSTRTRG